MYCTCCGQNPCTPPCRPPSLPPSSTTTMSLHLVHDKPHQQSLCCMLFSTSFQPLHVRYQRMFYRPYLALSLIKHDLLLCFCGRSAAFCKEIQYSLIGIIRSYCSCEADVSGRVSAVGSIKATSWLGLILQAPIASHVPSEVILDFGNSGNPCWQCRASRRARKLVLSNGVVV